MVSRKHGAPKHKGHVQDGERLVRARDQYPAILPWSLGFGWRPSFRSSGHLPGPAAGLLLDSSVHGVPAMLLRMIAFRQFESPLSGRSYENAREPRARASQNQRRMLCFSSSAL